MKKNGYVRRFLALFLTLVMIMADSSVTTFAATVGMVSTQSLNYVDVRLNAPDGTYYVAAMKDNGSWYEAKSQVAEVEVTGGYADTTLSVSDISDAQIVLLRLKQGSYSQNYDQSNYAVIKSNNILDYTKKVSGGEINGDAAEINVTTIGNTTVSDVYGSLGSATNYAVFAGTFYNAGDMEGNIATDSFHSDGSDIGDSGNVGQYTERLKIHTTKTVSGLKDTETFKFGLFDSNDKLVQVKALTFSKDGTQSFNFDTIELGSSSGTGSSSYKYSVYELEESKSGQYTYGSGKYNKVSNTYKDFTVSYSENTAIEIFNNDNYVKTASGTVKLRDGNLYTTSKSGEISISGQVNNVKYGLSDSEFTSRVTNGEYSSGGVSAMINGKLKTLARDLGTAKSGNGTQVIYITPNVLTGNSVYLPYNGNILADSAEKLVINMIVPDGITELDLLGGDIGIVDVGGTNIKDGKNWSKAGLNIVWNYIKEDGTPFNGTVKLGGGQLPGIQLLPDGTLYSGNNVSQLDVAKILHQIGGEIHKAPIQGERTAYVNISNTGASGTYTPVVKKELSGRELKEGEFSFTIAEVDSAGNAVTGGYTDTKSNAADGTVTFDTITYTTAKTYYYKVIEKVPENKLPGVTYTTDSYIITVTVTNNGNGTLNASADKGLDNLVFHNSYTSKKTGITFSGTKTLEGKTLEAGKFTFVLQETDKNWKAKDGKAAVTATNGANGAYSFGKIEYTEAGTYYYTVSEQGKGTTVEGITYDATEYKITVTVTDDGKGNLVAKADREVNNLDFKNSYSSQKTGITFSGTKTLEGKTLEAGKFTFVLQETDKNWKAKDGKAAVTATNGENGAYSFGKIEYTEAGTYYYTVSEQGKGTTVDGITYDATEYKITVTVTDDGKGKLVAKADREVNNLNFKNTYSSQKTEITFSGTKTLEGKTLEAGKFTFVLQETDKDWKAKDGKAAVTATNGENGAYSFGKIEYTKAGTYYYTVSEQGKGTTVDGITYDATEYKITVTVTDAGKGKLVAKADREVNNLNFKNTYSSQKTEITFSGTKTLEGKTLEAGKFTFVLQETDKDWKAKDGKAAVTATNGENGAYSFGKIEYTKAGTYYYTVSEQGKGTTVEGITYDATEYKITVTVTDDGKGNLVAKADREVNNLDFKNSYSSQKTEITFSGTKTLEGKTLEAGKFTFVLQETDKDGKAKDGKAAVTVTNGANGAYSFGKIEYTKAGTYYYTVSEQGKGTTVEGITYDATEYKITVTVTDDGKGNLVASADRKVDELNFTNTYKATGSTTLTATKTLTGRSFQSGDNWTFTVTASPTTAPMPEHPVITTSATSGNSETLNFGKINYTLKDVGTYVYTITESGNVTNVENDPNTARTVKVIVTDNGDGTLKVEQIEDAKNGLTFTNKYAEGETTLGVTKVLSGREFKDGDAWTFNLTADSETAPMPAETSVTTTATSGNSQSLTFGTIKYSLADVGNTYTYTITESGSGEGVTNDPNATRTVTVTVAEGSDGKLAITRTESEGGTVFTNIYNATGSLTLEANKKLKNKTLAAGAFSFELKELTAENTKVLETIPNEADGSVNFTTINYTLADVGTHTYTVSEVKGDDGTVTYDGTIYTVEATVTDAGNGTLNVSKVIKKNGEKVDSIDFTNTYVGEIEIAGTKTWNDNNDQEGIRPTSITVNLFANGEKVKDRR
ncbi:MAG: Spy0128 family protein [Ruminococcus sp.]